MSGTDIVAEIVNILTAGITNIAASVGQGLSTLATNVFLTGTGENQTLSVFGTLVVVFAGISLCIGLCRLAVMWISSLGGSRM